MNDPLHLPTPIVLAFEQLHLDLLAIALGIALQQNPKPLPDIPVEMRNFKLLQEFKRNFSLLQELFEFERLWHPFLQR